MSQTYTITYGTITIPFQINLKERKTLSIRVEPDSSVRVFAPLSSNIESISLKVKSKAAWILKQKNFFLGFAPITAQRQFVSGETHLYLGRQYRLRIVDIPEQELESVALSLGYITIKTKSRDKTHLKNLLNAWYQVKAENHFRLILKNTLPVFHRYKIEAPHLQIRFMEKRWGSCTAKGKILLNTELIKASKICIKYVIIHELCHLIESNHNKAFYKLLAIVLPDYETLKNKLEKMLA